MDLPTTSVSSGSTSAARKSVRHAKEAKLLSEHARKLLHRRRDVLSEATLADVEIEIDKLDAAAKTGDELTIKEASDRLDKVFGKVQPNRDDGGWRENCEVLLVAFVLAIAIRAYFLQPFKIPTGSMQPTLNGIIGHPVSADKPLPNALVRGFQSLWLGRTYLDAVSAVDDEILALEPVKRFGFLDYTNVVCRSGHSYLLHTADRVLRTAIGSDGFGLYPRRQLRAGEPIARGYVDTGDQVFVDKFTYNFRLPRRSDVFVFSTRDIAGIEMDDPLVKSEFYIKRLGALAGDTLRIDAPRLYRDGVLAPEAGFQRVMQAQHGYRGYSNPPRLYKFHFLLTPSDTFTVPAKTYFALGDNSYNSFDSRGFGPVPAGNVVGRGLFVYWPFNSHWGVIH